MAHTRDAAVLTAAWRGKDTAARRPRWAAIWLPMVAPLVVFARGLLGQRLLAPGDGYEHYLPLHILAARAWKAVRGCLTGASAARGRRGKGWMRPRSRA